MITIEQVQGMGREQCRDLIPRLHEQHDYIAWSERKEFFQPFAYSPSKPIPPKFGWPDLPTDKHQIDVMLIVCLEKVGSDVVHISQVMDEYLDHLEHQATLNEGGFSDANEQEQK
ncbi:hypothetical protein AA310_12325 [Arthrobacter sp. YC-RL1]|uniref:hypothetical protein n=1 Tax=Arthrobacter sp. YC-RL1 TaxID=1652545 RepID=UPI00063DAF24|nr:hypothetical protein [Arthrobacter sp. YC-RL1]ALQ30103.1 hypothetical protein ATC04_05715 [Arthrobacter sp. YC-RL1]KLI88574.1 hypothetical protein AA310_12325 [Arthrobacter sp. YC-RL1]